MARCFCLSSLFCLSLQGFLFLPPPLLLLHRMPPDCCNPRGNDRLGQITRNGNSATNQKHKKKNVEGVFSQRQHPQHETTHESSSGNCQIIWIHKVKTTTTTTTTRGDELTRAMEKRKEKRGRASSWWTKRPLGTKELPELRDTRAALPSSSSSVVTVAPLRDFFFFFFFSHCSPPPKWHTHTLTESLKTPQENKKKKTTRKLKAPSERNTFDQRIFGVVIIISPFFFSTVIFFIFGWKKRRRNWIEWCRRIKVTKPGRGKKSERAQQQSKRRWKNKTLRRRTQQAPTTYTAWQHILWIRTILLQLPRICIVSFLSSCNSFSCEYANGIIEGGIQMKSMVGPDGWGTGKKETTCLL